VTTTLAAKTKIQPKNGAVVGLWELAWSLGGQLHFSQSENRIVAEQRARWKLDACEERMLGLLNSAASLILSLS